MFVGAFGRSARAAVEHRVAVAGHRLDRADRRYRIGEVVAGRVEVRVDADCTCNGLEVTRLWATHGKGNRAQGAEESQTLFTGTWRAGETHDYEFRFTIPPGPLTYHGEYLNVDHYIQATADIPWAFDPSAEEELLEPEVIGRGREEQEGEEEAPRREGKREKTEEKE